MDYKEHLDKKMLDLPFLADVRAIEDRLDVSEEVAMDLNKFYQKYQRKEVNLSEVTLREYLEKIEQDVESGQISPKGISKSGLVDDD